MSSDTKQSILSAFASLGHPPLPPPVLSRVAALASSTGLTPAQLAEAWDAHSLSRGVDVLDDDTFGGYRSSLSGHKAPRQKSALSRPGGQGAGGNAARNTAVLKNGTGLGKRTSPGGAVTPTPHSKRVTVKTEANTTRSIPRINNQGRGGISAVDNLTTPGGNARNGSSPRDTKVKFEAGAGGESKSVTPPKTPKFSERGNAGQVVARYNPDLPSAAEVLSSRTEAERESIGRGAGCTVSNHGGAAHPAAEFRHMFAPLEKRSAALEERLVEVGEAMRVGLGVKTEEEEMLEMDCTAGGRDDANDGEAKGGDGFVGTWTPVGVPKQNTVVCVGRICNEVS